MTKRTSHDRSARGLSRPTAMRLLAATVVLGVGITMAAAPAAAQGRGKSDPIGHSQELSGKPTPSLPASPEPRERIVPEQRVRDPLTGKEVIVPQHTEGPGQPPPSTGYGTRGQGPVLAPPKDSR
jgi:hypothetical protein